MKKQLRKKQGINQRQYLMKIDGIEIVEKSVRKEAVGNPEDFLFGVNCQLVLNSAEKTVIVFTRVLIRRRDLEIPIANFNIAVGFYIDNYFDFFTEDNANSLIPEDISLMLRSMAISTTRGVLYAELRGTGLHSAYLPVIDPISMTPFKN